MSKELGELRPSQLMFYHGPGSIVDMLSGSVMIMAADMWKIPSTEVEDERVRRALGVSKVKLLNENQEKIEVKAVQFPKWKVCPKCGMMTDFKVNDCYYCKKDRNLTVELFPSRFVLACKHGHIKDFPWAEWLHQGAKCDKPILKMKSKGMGGSLSDMTIHCIKCKKKRSLASIMKYEESCTGNRPWIGDQVECKDGEVMEPVFRGAAKLYSPILHSVLSIPLKEGTEESLYEKVNKNREALLSAKNLPKEYFHNFVCSLFNIEAGKIPQILSMLEENYIEQASFETIRKQEWNTLTSNVEVSEETGYKAFEVDVNEKMKKYFSSIVKIESLPEMQVLKGFTRLQYPDPFDKSDIPISSIMKSSKTKWLPAVKNLGEGIFFKFNHEQLLEWERRSSVLQETEKIYDRYNRRRQQMTNEPISLEQRYLLLHTFSHAMIQEFARFSGYATTSLRERIYSGKDMYGVLIYTASSDSEGSLGGLIELSKAEKLYPLFVRALAKMEYCSSDPHCSDADFQLQSTINGAACHACAFVSETSCEWGNQLLDRRVLLPLNDDKSLSFFEI